MSSAFRPGHRLFVAYELPDAPRASLADLARRIARDHDDARAVDAESLHATVLFLGTVADDRQVELVTDAFDAMSGVAISTGIAAVVGRPRAGAARLAAAELSDPTGTMARHAAAVAAHIAPVAGLHSDERPFWPHVTLVRFRRPTRMRRFPTHESEHVFVIDRITLYDSYIGSNGPPRYQALMTVPLGSLVERKHHDG